MKIGVPKPGPAFPECLTITKCRPIVVSRREIKGKSAMGMMSLPALRTSGLLVDRISDLEA